MQDLVFQFKVGLGKGGEWTWSKRLGDTVLQCSSETFDSLGLCLDNARHNGYSGELWDAAAKSLSQSEAESRQSPT